MPERIENVWYREGLPFRCTQCGNCCTGAPGYVWVTAKEVEKIAEFLGRPDKGLTSKHLRRVGRRFSLTEDVKNGDCCFLETKDGIRGCSIYPVRPLQCRTWPFWKSNLRSPETWADAAENCPGMHYGKHYDLVQIKVRRDAKRWEDLPK